MKRTPPLRLARYGLISLAVLGVAGTCLGLYTAAVRRDQDESRKRTLHERLRRGVGSEVRLAGPGAQADVHASVNSLARFIYARSGVRLSGRVRARLAELEERTLSGAARPLTVEDLSAAASLAAVQRASTLTDEQINYIAESLRGFDAPDLPESFRRSRGKVKVRASRAGVLTPEQLVEQIAAVRRADGASRTIFLGAARNVVADEVRRRKRTLGEALPEQFGTPDSPMTPVQAFLITYAVASDDSLTESEADLRRFMHKVQEKLSGWKGQPYPSPEGRFAYGPNGYLFSTPMDLVLGDETADLLLNHLAERSARR